jgi:hypothetical protein
MNILGIINSIIVGIGIPSLIGALILIGKKLQILDTLSEEINNNIRPDLKDVRERFSALEGKSAGLFQNNSPVGLTPKGTKILHGSELKSYIDSNIDFLQGGCSEKGNFNTPYDLQESVFNFFDSFIFPKEIENKLKTYAYNQGISMDAMRRIGAIYFRDICLAQQGFKPEDLDKTK